MDNNPYRPPNVAVEHYGDAARPIPVFRLLVALVVSLLIPGLPSLYLCWGRSGWIRSLVLLLSIPASFLFWGPFWDMVLFPGTVYGQYGYYPFVATVIFVPVISFCYTVRDWQRLKDERSWVDDSMH